MYRRTLLCTTMLFVGWLPQITLSTFLSTYDDDYQEFSKNTDINELNENLNKTYHHHHYYAYHKYQNNNHHHHHRYHHHHHSQHSHHNHHRRSDETIQRNNNGNVYDINNRYKRQHFHNNDTTITEKNVYKRIQLDMIPKTKANFLHAHENYNNENQYNWTSIVNKYHSKRQRYRHHHNHHHNHNQNKQHTKHQQQKQQHQSHYQDYIFPNNYTAETFGNMPNIKSASRSVSDLFVDMQAPVTTVVDESTEWLHWPVKKEAIMEGDLILGGLMMVHSREDTMMCGPIMPQGGIQALEAMLYTLDRINKGNLLPNITIGAHVLDDCDRDSYGLEMAVDFIKGKLNFSFMYI